MYDWLLIDSFFVGLMTNITRASITMSDHIVSRYITFKGDSSNAAFFSRSDRWKINRIKIAKIDKMTYAASEPSVLRVGARWLRRGIFIFKRKMLFLSSNQSKVVSYIAIKTHHGTFYERHKSIYVPKRLKRQDSVRVQYSLIEQRLSNNIFMLF